MSLRRVDCVSAVLVKDGGFLVEKRRLDDTDPGFVELPGGHVEEGESLEEALRREVLEELGLEILGLRLVFVGNYTASDGERQRIHYFLVSDWKGLLVSREAGSVEWISDPAVLSLDVDRTAVGRARMFTG